jgi:uncharacterized membrane protein
MRDSSPPAPASQAASRRKGYLDWLRGLAVLVMITAHVLDSWTRYDARESPLFRVSMIVAGLGAPLFLFLAGVSVSLSAAAKVRRTGDATGASRAVVRRGLEVFVLAFLFRLQACILSWGAWRTLLKIDVLNIMGPSIMATAALWGRFRTTGARCLAFAAAAIAIGLVTPPVRATSLLSFLPDPIEGYLRPRPGYTNFAFFPWAGFVFAGAVPGALLASVPHTAAERTAVVRIAAAGGAVGLAALGAAFFPSPYAQSEFWTSSPSYFFLRTGILVALIGVAYAWERRPWGAVRWSPLQQLGRTSLFIYWIHVEMVYGLIVRPLHKSMSLPEAWISVVVFSLFMLICSISKERVAESIGHRDRGLGKTWWLRQRTKARSDEGIPRWP